MLRVVIESPQLSVDVFFAGIRNPLSGQRDHPSSNGPDLMGVNSLLKSGGF